MERKLFAVLFITFGLKSLCSQNDTIQVTSSRQYYNYIDNYLGGITTKFGAGVFIPQGNLDDYFGIAPLFELSVNFPLKRGKSIDAILQFIVPNQKDDFLYLRTVDTLRVKSTFMFNSAIRLKRLLYSSRLSKLNINLGIGISTINTNARNPFYSGADGEKKYEFISTLLILPGIEWSHKISNNLDLTFGFDFQYSPYKIEGALREEIGSVGLVPKLSCKF